MLVEGLLRRALAGAPPHPRPLSEFRENLAQKIVIAPCLAGGHADYRNLIERLVL